MPDRRFASTEDGAFAPVLVVDNHDSYTYNLVQQVAGLTGTFPDVVPVDALDVELACRYRAVVVSPGPGHPATEPAFHRCIDLFAARSGPTLGVCLGHQGLIVANGGEVQPVTPAHGVLETLSHQGTGLFRGIPQDTMAVRYHSLAATEVPEVLQVTARSQGGVVMAVQHRERLHFGVQFHPESILTTDGDLLIANFLRMAGIEASRGSAERRVTTHEKTTGAPSHMIYEGWIDPALAAAHILRGRERAFWLDSADAREWTGRYSVLGYLTDDERSIVEGTEDEQTTGAERVRRSEFLGHLRRLEGELDPMAGTDVPAVGGWVGVAGYETQELLLGSDAGSSLDGFCMKVNRAVVFDHARREVSCYAETIDQRAELAAMLDAAQAGRPPLISSSFAGSPMSLDPTAWYEAAFARVEEALHAGDSYESVLTFPLEFLMPGDPLDHYLALRARNPAPYCAFLKHGSSTILSTSPERMLAVSPDGWAEIRPIKGTLPRDDDEQADALARWRLGSEEKFRRGNLMIVDLIRNDLGKVCETDSVTVTDLMRVETYRGVHQLVSAIRGRLRNEHSAIDCLRAAFPAGSMTGAPKRRTMELIRDIEWQERGAYAGAIGWFTSNAAEFAVVIRTLQGRDERYRLDVGGGILVGSSPDTELEEALVKARSVVGDEVIRSDAADRTDEANAATRSDVPPLGDPGPAAATSG